MRLRKWKKKMADPGERPLKQGAIEKQCSYIMAVPRPQTNAAGNPVPIEELLSWDKIVSRLKETDLFQLFSYKTDVPMEVNLSYGEQEYSVHLELETLNLPELYTMNHQLSEADLSGMKAAKGGLTASMTFGKDILESYLVQIKVLCCIVPDMVGLVDFSSERILSGVWADMAARSKVAPAPSYIYSIQAVNDEHSVWLHTHGLNRCGSVELEILGSDREHYQDHAMVLQTVAGNVITKEPLGEERDLFWISTLSDGRQLMGTWLDWTLAVRFYERNELGGAAEHEEDPKLQTGVLFFYLSPEDFQKKQFVPITAFNDALADNPMMMISIQETERMRALAAERLDCFRREIEKPGINGLMKFGLEVDAEYRKDEDLNLEHLWFEVLSMGTDTVHCKRTQDAYYIKALNEGDEMDLPLSKLTDWVLYTEERQITPDSVYLLEL